MQAPFSLIQWSAAIPLCDDLWFGMHARNIAIVDQVILRAFEHDVLQAYMEYDKAPLEMLMPLHAMSNMWMFALYEFLRTWRQRAKQLITLADKCAALPKPDRKAFLEAEVKKAQGKEKFSKPGVPYYSEQVAKIGKAGFMKKVRTYYASSDNLFRSVEMVRVNVAKHEVPKTDGFMAFAPGYVRVDPMSGSIVWFVVLKDMTQFSITRRSLGNQFLGLSDGWEDAGPGDASTTE